MALLSVRAILMKNGTFRIGTSGIALAGAKNTFPEQYQSGSRLQYYGSLFNTIEINSSFYRIPSPKTQERWAQEVPDDFQFTIKVWREITHPKKLIITEDVINTFIKGMQPIAKKKGCLLIQFPGKISISYLSQVEKILLKFHHEHTEEKWKLAVEFRDSSWYTEATYFMLEKINAAIVFHDIPKSKTPFDYTLSPFVYFRFHGPAGDYRGSYTTEQLKVFASMIINCLNQGKDAYAYFNNTMGSAYENAQLLKKMVQEC